MLISAEDIHLKYMEDKRQEEENKNRNERENGYYLQVLHQTTSTPRVLFLHPINPLEVEFFQSLDKTGRQRTKETNR